MLIPHKLSGILLIGGFLIFFIATCLWKWQYTVLGLVLMWIGFGLELDIAEHQRLRYTQLLE